jgi:hypothetical protein
MSSLFTCTGRNFEIIPIVCLLFCSFVRFLQLSFLCFLFIFVSLFCLFVFSFLLFFPTSSISVRPLSFLSSYSPCFVSSYASFILSFRHCLYLPSSFVSYFSFPIYFYEAPMWSSGQSSWLHIQRSGFNSRRYEIFSEK